MEFLDWSDKELVKLPQISDIVPLKRLYCNNNELTELNELPDSLELLYCDRNKLIRLPPLPPHLKFLWCDNNQLTEIGEFPPNLEELCCYNNPMTHLPRFPTSLEIIWISPWQIASCLNNWSDLKDCNALIIIIINRD
jgi:Leucine-rich repeat (LRR) protein